MRVYSSSKKADDVIPKNVLNNPATQNQPNGPIIDNKPFKIALKAGLTNLKFEVQH